MLPCVIMIMSVRRCFFECEYASGWDPETKIYVAMLHPDMDQNHIWNSQPTLCNGSPLLKWLGEWVDDVFCCKQSFSVLVKRGREGLGGGSGGNVGEE